MTNKMVVGFANGSHFFLCEKICDERSEQPLENVASLLAVISLRVVASLLVVASWAPRNELILPSASR